MRAVSVGFDGQPASRRAALRSDDVAFAGDDVYMPGLIDVESRQSKWFAAHDPASRCAEHIEVAATQVIHRWLPFDRKLTDEHCGGRMVIRHRRNGFLGARRA